MSLQTLDFLKCFFCQSDSVVDFKNPADQKISKTQQAGNVNPYSNLADLILQFNAIGEFPFDHDIQELNNFPGGLAQFLHINHAKYHKNCRSKFNSSQLKRAKKRVSPTEDNPVPAKTRATNTKTKPENSKSQEVIIEKCLFCEQPEGDAKLHKCTTLRMDSKVRMCANIIGDEELQRKLSSGDLIAIDGCYHLNCLAALYRKANKIKKTSDESEIELDKAFSDLINYIERLRDSGKSIKMADIVELYTHRLESLGITDTYIHSTRLRQALIHSIEGLKDV